MAQEFQHDWAKTGLYYGNGMWRWIVDLIASSGLTHWHIPGILLQVRSSQMEIIQRFCKRDEMDTLLWDELEGTADTLTNAAENPKGLSTVILSNRSHRSGGALTTYWIHWGCSFWRRTKQEKKRFFRFFLNLQINGSFKNCLQKSSSGNQKWFSYDIIMKKPILKT